MITRKKTMIRPYLLLLSLLVAGCEKHSVDANEWLGRWQGVEGTYLDIAKADDGYAVTIANLDGPREFSGVADKDGLSFERDGVSERIRDGNGQDTGMKWLAGKQNCLVVKPGEGYCRD